MPAANEWCVTTLAPFWGAFGHCTNPFEFFLVPPGGSVQDVKWGTGRRASLIEKLMNPYLKPGYVSFTRPLAEVWESTVEAGRADWSWQACFEHKDHLHMHRDATVALHKQLWREITEAQLRTNTLHRVPVLVFDFNSSAKHLENNMQEHRAIWGALFAWGALDGLQDPDRKAAATAAVEVAVRRSKSPPLSTFQDNFENSPPRAGCDEPQPPSQLGMFPPPWNVANAAVKEVRVALGLLTNDVEARKLALHKSWPPVETEDDLRWWTRVLEGYVSNIRRDPLLRRTAERYVSAVADDMERAHIHWHALIVTHKLAPPFDDPATWASAAVDAD